MKHRRKKKPKPTLKRKTKEPKPKPASRVPTHEVEARVTAILAIRLQGAMFSDILQFAQENGWGVSNRQVCRYIEQSDEAIAEQIETKREKIVNTHLAQRQYLYMKALQAGDFRAALAAKQDEAKLLGLYEPQQIKHTIDTTYTERRETVIQILTNEPSYLDYLRAQAIEAAHESTGLSIDSGGGTGSNGHAHHNGAPANGHHNGHALPGTNGHAHEPGPMETGETPEPHRPGSNEHSSGST